MYLPPNAWLVIHVLSRSESHVAELLRYKSYEYFLPMRQTKNGKKQSRNVALFGGYIFCRCNPDAVPLIVTTPGVLRILSFGGAPAVVDDTEICAIKQVISSGNQYSPSPYLGVGQVIRVLDGPLQGLQGILKEVKNRRRAVISVDLLMRSVEVDISCCDIEMLDRRDERQYAQIKWAS
jgi:transcription antitermination factor NusG